MKKTMMFVLLALAGLTRLAPAKVDLVTLPARDTVQLTIYNSADLTLVRDLRTLTLIEGANSLQFSWANTLIDPTSLELTPKEHADQIETLALTYPPRVKNLGVWQLHSGLRGKAAVEITYLTSGLSWRAFYDGTLTADETAMRLEGYVRVLNNSGEDYENAQVRLIVGQVHLIDEIAELARREYPYNRPGYERFVGEKAMPAPMSAAKPRMLAMARGGADMMSDVVKEITKEGLSEYFLYTIEGAETIPNGWSKRLPSIKPVEVPVLNLYKYDEERFGSQVLRYLSFKNDKAHKLGETPLPDGNFAIYRTVDAEKHLAYEGQSGSKYIPVNEKVELMLGAVQNVVVEPRLMDFKTDKYQFDQWGNISGWDEIREFRMEVKNTRDLPVKVEITRHIPTAYWELTKSGDFGTYEQVDKNTVKFTIELKARAQQVFTYVLTTHHGTREK